MSRAGASCVGLFLLLLLPVAVPVALGPPLPGAVSVPQLSGRTLPVGPNLPDGPTSFASIQEAVEAAGPGDRIRVHPGVYHEAVRITTPGLTLEGVDRAGVVLDGAYEPGFLHGVHVLRAPGVTVQNLTVRNYLANGVYVYEADRFAVRRVTAQDNVEYGIYAKKSRHGVFADSEASGSGDSGFYFGETAGCNCTLRDSVAHGNVIGYSGTRVTGVVIRDSHFFNNSLGIIPNALVPDLVHMITEHASPEVWWAADHVIVDNVIEGNNNRQAKAAGWTARFGVPIGTGVAMAGAMDSVVAGNTIRGHERWGIAEFFFLVPPLGNRYVGNFFRDNGVDFWRDGYGWGSCQDAHPRGSGAGSYLGCHLPPFLRLSLPNPGGHVRLLLETETPQGRFDTGHAHEHDHEEYAPAGVAALAALGGILPLLAAAGGAGGRKSPPARPRRRGERRVLGLRLGAALLDGLVVLGLYLLLVGLLILALFPSATLPDLLEGVATLSVVFSPLAFLLYFALWFGYGAVLEARFGQTLGKRLLGLTVVGHDGAPLTPGASLLRNALRFVDGVGLNLLGLLLILLTGTHRRLGDRVARTRVVPAG